MRPLTFFLLSLLIAQDAHAKSPPPTKVAFQKLTHRFQGRDYRLTDVHGHVIKDILT